MARRRGVRPPEAPADAAGTSAAGDPPAGGPEGPAQPPPAEGPEGPEGLSPSPFPPGPHAGPDEDPEAPASSGAPDGPPEEGPGAPADPPTGEGPGGPAGSDDLPDDPDKIVHSSQLDERLRRGEARATPKDKRNHIIVDVLMIVGFLLLVSVLLGKVGLLIQTDIAVQTLTLGVATGVLSGASYLFQTIHWRALRRPKGAAALDKSRSDLLLTIVSIAALFTVVLMVFIELLALVAFTGLMSFGAAGARFADNFVLFQTIMLLVYVLALVVRENHASSFVPSPRAQQFAKYTSPAAGLFVLMGVLVAFRAPQALGILEGLDARQGVYIITLGVLMEFMAMRVRLRLPSLVSRFKEAVDLSLRANDEIRKELKKRALRSYMVATFFVVGSMAFAGAVITGAVPGFGTRGTLALVIFYVGSALIILGLIAVRVLQGRELVKETGYADSTMDDLLARKRKQPAEIFRVAVYSVGSFVAAICFVFAVIIGMGMFSDVQTETREVLDEDGEPLLERGQPVMEDVDVEQGIHPKFGTDAFLLGLLLAVAPFGFFYNQERKRTEIIDEKFPDFLRDIAESARAGMTLTRALVTASQGTYGALTPEIQKMAAQVEWGVDFKEALERFAQRTRTRLIDRTVSLVVEAQRAGGNVVDILTAASEDAREIKQIISERNEQMSLYKVVIYIAFFVFIAVVLILSAQFIPAFKDAVSAAEGQQVGGLKFEDFDPEDFNTLFFHAAIVQAIGGGLVGGVLTKGNPAAGLGAIAIMVVISWFCFRIVMGVLF